MSGDSRRVMTIYGTRPEAIKVAPVIKALEVNPHLESVVAVTGQHREMLDQMNTLFGIHPSHDLDLMRPGADLVDLTSAALSGVSRVITQVRPDAVMVQGDTSTALAAALAAFYLKVPIVHLEAGLRTGQMHSPFPEEANRRLIAPLASLHLAPTTHARSNLLREGIEPTQVVVTGNTVIDALHSVLEAPRSAFEDEQVEKAVARDGALVLVTIHRRESWGEPLAQSARVLRELATREPEVTFVIPRHKNPVVRDCLDGELMGIQNVILTEPMSYQDFARCMGSTHVIVTDSGGVQEEAPSLGKPVLVLRDNTERPEAVAAGTVKLVGSTARDLGETLSLLLHDADAYAAMANAVNPYGDGRAAARAVAAIEELLGLGRRQADFEPEGAIHVR